MNDENILNELILESKDHLTSIEPDLLALEKGGEVPKETINRIFRAMHSIKGGFGFFGIESIKSLSHSMENVMMRIRDGGLAVTPPVVDALLAGTDKLRVMLDDVRHSDQIAYDDVAHLLSAFVSTKEAAAQPKQAHNENAKIDEIALSGLPLSREQLLSIAKHGRHVYLIRVLLKSDLEKKDRNPLDFLKEIESYGELHESWTDLSEISGLDDCLQKELACVFVMSSVLETDLMQEAIRIDRSQIRAFTKQTILKELESNISTEIPKPVKEPQSGKTPNQPSGPEKPTETSDTVRVKVELLNKLVNLAGELVLSRNQLMQRFKTEEEPGVKNVLQNIDLVTSELQESIMNTRMQPIGNIFGKFPRVVRDLSKSLNKEVLLTLSGESVEMDKSIIEALTDPLTHLVRNSVDHGIESPPVREKAGKTREGHIVLRAFHESGQVNVEILDDGKGIDVDRVRKKAVENGILTQDQAQAMPPKEIFGLLFEAGFSTAEKVTDLSGRGVGLDVVRTNIEKLGGLVEVDSEKGSGTTFTLKLPLTLAIIPSLLVTCEGRRFAIPQVSLEELVRLRAGDASRKIEKVQGKDVLRLRGKLLPLVRLNSLLKIPPTYTHPETRERKADMRRNLADRRQGHQASETEQRGARSDRRISSKSAVNIVVLKVGRNRFGLIVENMIDTEEIVVKPLSGYVISCKCYAGATILGDGTVAMILDPIGIANLAGLRFTDLERENRAERERSLGRSAKEAKQILLFDNGTTERFAMDLSEIARIEKISCSKINRIGDLEFLKHETDALRLLRLDHCLPVASPDQPWKSCFVIVPKKARKPFGIVAAKVHDVVNTEVLLDEKSLQGAGLKGSAVIQSALTLVLDVDGLQSAVELCTNGIRRE